jgi:hypothetical protein
MQLKNLLGIALVAATTFAQAQDNVVKLDLPPLILAAGGLGHASLHYERMITPRQSVNANVSFMFPKVMSAADIKQLNDAAVAQSTTGNTSDINLTAGTLGGFQITPEYRFYTSDAEGPRGFYIGPQLHFHAYNGELTGTHLYGTNNDKVSADKVGLTWTQFGIGGQLGWQWIIGDHVSIDWGLLGVGVGFGTITAYGETQDKDQLTQWATDANDALAKNSSASFVKVNNDGARLQLSGSTVVPHLRTSLCIGYAF